MNIERRLASVIIFLVAIAVLGGCGGGGSGTTATPPPPPPADTTAPTVSAVQAPAAVVNRVVTLTLTATDNVGVTAVRFFVDGMLLGSDNAAPYMIDWDTAGESEGDHTLTAEAEDAAGNIATSAAATATVQNVLVIAVSPGGNEEVPLSDSLATAQISLTVNLATGDVQGTLTTSGIAATAAHIHDAFAGTNGPVLVSLDQDAADPAIFTVPGGATLDTTGIDRLLAGALYINVHSAAAPGGEIRGQILPDGFVLRFSDLTGFAAVPQVNSLATGRAATTLDQISGAIVVQAQVVGLDDATVAHVHQAFAGAAGAVLVALGQDPLDVSRWFVEDASLNAAGLDAFMSGQLYINIHSPANPGGEIRGQILPAGITVIFAELSGLQEVPAVDTPDSGLAAVTLDEAGALLSIHVNTNGLSDASASHLHSAFGGTNGPVEIGLTQDGNDPEHWFVEQQTIDTAQLTAILAGGTYVNVHSPANLGGEVRGQVIADGIVFAFGVLDGNQRVPVVATVAIGTLAVTADPVSGTVTTHVNSSGVDNATVAHIHDGYAGTNGAVVIGLGQDPNDAGHWSAVDAPIDAAQLAALSSGRYYVNVHTPANPAGEIRGQIAPPPIEVLFTNMSGDQEVPPVVSAANGIAASTVDRINGTVTLHLNANGADVATASHIHVGPAGENGAVLISLEQDMADVGHWSVIGAQLDSMGVASYKSGQLYVNLHTPANTGGEIRGQVVPPDAAIFDIQTPAVSLTSPGATVNGIVTLNADASDDQGVVEVRFLADGMLIASDATAPYSIDWDSTTVGNGQVTLTAEADDAASNTGVSADVVVDVQNVAAVTLSMLQAQIFGPTCSVPGCHSGPTSNSLPSGMNLTSTANSFNALVNVMSLQSASLNRVTPGDPDNSYIIQKLEGTAAGSSRMPLGGPFLDQATIDMVRQWISEGAMNN